MKIVLVTSKKDVLCNIRFNSEGLMPCNQEVDTQIFLYVRHAVTWGTHTIDNKSKWHKRLGHSWK